MARVIFYPSNDSYTLNYQGEPQAGVPVKVYSRQSGGTQITDLVYVGYDGSTGAAVPSGILISDGFGLLPAFAGPDGGATTLWGNHGPQGERIALSSEPGAGGGGGAVSSVVGQTGAVTGTQILADTTVSAALALKAPLASPAFTGNPTVPTATVGDNDTTAASTAFTTAAVAVETTRATTAEALAALKSANLSDLASASTARTNLGLAAAATMTTAQIAADAALTGAFGPILNVHLLAWALAQAFRLVSATRDSNDAITTASVVWPDGSTGTFTTDTASTAFPGAIDAYHVTYVNATTGTKTVTQTAVTRNSNGAVTAQPAPTVA